MFINRLKVDKSVDKVADLLILNKIIKPSEESFYILKQVSNYLMYNLRFTNTALVKGPK